jgi:hypothetical protein
MIFAWQGWQVAVPNTWNPLKLEGDFAGGYALLADLHRPRLAIRWSTPRSDSFDPVAWAQKRLSEEVGRNAQFRSRPIENKFFRAVVVQLEPEPPGRDMWVAHSRLSNRNVELIYHAPSRDSMLQDDIAPTLIDSAASNEHRWSVFQLSCISPAGYALKSHELKAGDLSMTFARRHDQLSVRQIAIAWLAL